MSEEHTQIEPRFAMFLLQEQLKSTESRLKEARKRLEEVELENVGLKEVVKKLPTHRSSQGGARGASGITMVVFQNPITSAVYFLADACDSGGSGGWSDLGGDVDEAAALQTARMADITNVAQLHARIKTLSTELDRTKSALSLPSAALRMTSASVAELSSRRARKGESGWILCGRRRRRRSPASGRAWSRRSESGRPSASTI